MYAALDFRQGFEYVADRWGDEMMNGNAQKIVATVMLATLGRLIADQRGFRSPV